MEYRSVLKGELSIPYKLGHPLEEEVVITLHAHALQPGIHTYTTDTIITSRLIMEDILSSLGFYGSRARITSHPGLPATAVDDIASHYALLPLDSEEALEASLIQFDYDLLIIEQTQELQTMAWYQTFEQIGEKLKVFTHRPVFLWHYD